MVRNRVVTGLLLTTALAVVSAACVPPPGGAGPVNTNMTNANLGNTSVANANTRPANTNTNTGAAASTADASVSARSDSVTGGRIERGEIVKGGGDLRITINVPAYQLTLWQGKKEISVWPIAIGKPEFPLPAENRKAEQLILNPDWIPPNSEWVAEVKDVKPGEVVPPGDKRNPLGDIKIRLGDDGTLIHEARTRAELGKPVSHGCARMIEGDLVDLVEKIAVGQGLSLTGEEIRAAIKTDEKRDVKLDEVIPVDISYDTAVVEGGTLYLYPDVYEKKTAETAVRDELSRAGVDATALDAKTLSALLARPKGAQGFAVPIADIRAGRALTAGKNVSLATASRPGDGKVEKSSEGDREARQPRGRR